MTGNDGASHLDLAVDFVDFAARVDVNVPIGGLSSNRMLW